MTNLKKYLANQKKYMEKLKKNTGKDNSGLCNSGNYNSGDFNTSHYNSGDFNTGRYNGGHRNSANHNSGYSNSGNFNSGNSNSGDNNTNYCNSGNFNSGNFNSGNFNSGDFNSGDYNSSNFNSGIFNTNEPKMRSFNKECDYTYRQFREKWGWNDIKLPITEWVKKEDMTEEEKKTVTGWETMDGYLKTALSFKEAWRIGWSKATQKQKDWYKSLPNFNPEIFKEITGIDVNDE